MMRWFSVLFLLLSILILEPVNAQDAACPALVDQALALLDTACADLDRNTVCYGFNRVDATFTEIMADDFFSQPADRAELLQLQTLQTAPLDIALGQWGIAAMSIQANVPNSLPGQSVRFLLMGDAMIENAVAPAEAFVSDIDSIEVAITANANVRSTPSSTANLVGGASVGSVFAADGLSPDRSWVRIQYMGMDAWVIRSVVTSANDLDALPTISREQRSPMQGFYFRTGIGEPACVEAPPSMVVIQGPRRIDVNLSVNGANIIIGSTIALTQPAPQIMRLTVIDGALYLENGFAVPRGFAIDGQLDERGLFTGVWSNNHTLTPAEIAALLPLENTPLHLLNYRIDVPTLTQIQAIRDTVLSEDPTPVPQQPADEIPSLFGPEQTVPGGVSVQFDANPSAVQPGECVQLNWNVGGARAVFFDGGEVSASGSATRCPGGTTTYSLRVVSQAGTESGYSLQIQVLASPPPDDSGEVPPPGDSPTAEPPAAAPPTVEPPVAAPEIVETPPADASF